MAPDNSANGIAVFFNIFNISNHLCCGCAIGAFNAIVLRNA
jgi:hypothetical protein